MKNDTFCGARVWYNVRYHCGEFDISDIFENTHRVHNQKMQTI